jgi:hypothetical protein
MPILNTYFDQQFAICPYTCMAVCQVQVKGTIFFFWFGYGFLVLKGLGHLFNGRFLVLSSANLNEL